MTTLPYKTLRPCLYALLAGLALASCTGDEPADGGVADQDGHDQALAVLATLPQDGQASVALDAPLTITFSAPNIDPQSGTIALTPPVPGLSRTWTSHTELKIVHDPFAPNTTYMVVISGYRVGALPPMEAYTFTFTTLAGDLPRLTVASTTPPDGATAVLLSTPVTIVFSEEVANPTEGQVVLSPTPTALVTTWSDGNTKLSLEHSPFEGSQLYDVTVSAFRAAGGEIMEDHHFTFETMEVNAGALMVMATWPSSGEGDVAVDAPLIINFSHPVTNGEEGLVTLDPPVAGLSRSWSEGDTTLTLLHDPLMEGQAYTMTVSGFTAEGLETMVDTVVVFTTEAVVTPGRLEVLSTTPVNGAVDAPVDVTVSIAFSHPVTNPDGGQITVDPPMPGLARSWSEGVDELVLTHDPLASDQAYAVTLSGFEALGQEPMADLTFTFTTEAVVTPGRLEIISSTPSSGATNVNVDGDLILNFSAAVTNPEGGEVTLEPEVGGLSRIWSEGGDALTLSHDPLANDQAYTMTVSGLTAEGLETMVDTVIAFTTEAVVTPGRLEVLSTMPVTGAEGVAVDDTVSITFSHPVTNPDGGQITVDPPMPGLARSWSEGVDELVLLHDPLANDQAYSVTLSGFEAQGREAMVDLTFTFTTEAVVTPGRLEIISSTPFDGEANVRLDRAVEILFSEAVANQVEGTVTAVPALVSPSPAWSGDGTRLTLSHGGFVAGQSYAVTVTAFRASEGDVMEDHTFGFTARQSGGDPTKPYAVNPTFGQRVAPGAIVIDGHNNDEWTEDHLIALDMANDDPRSLGDNWSMHEGPFDLTHLWAAWDDDNLYLAWQYVDVTDILDPANAGSAHGSSPAVLDLIQWIALDTRPGEGAQKDMWGKNGGEPYWTGADLPDVQIYIASNLWQGYISRAVDGVFPVDDGGVNYHPVAEVGIEAAVGSELASPTLWGVGDADSAMDPGALRDFAQEGHDGGRDTFYEMKIPLSALGDPDLEGEGLGVMLGQGEMSCVDTIPNDPATSDTPGTSPSNSPLEWGDVDSLTADFARVGR